MRRFVIGDIHGYAHLLEQCLIRSGFDKNKDMLVCLGDVCDRGRFVKESFDILLEIKNLVYVMGNHDMWLLDWVIDGNIDKVWLLNGGRRTMDSYRGRRQNVPEEHVMLLDNAPNYYLSDDNRLFVHAGIEPGVPIGVQREEDLLYGRNFVLDLLDIADDVDIERITSFDEIYIGHTPTVVPDFDSEVPLNIKEVWMMDTGVALGKKISIMDIDTKEYWQSDMAK